MSENIEIKDYKKIIPIGVIIITIVILSSIVIYSSVIKPQRYSNYLDLGNKYLLEQNYEEAILAFEKAIKIDEKSTDARVGAAKAYIGTNNIDSAIVKLKEVQNLDIENEELLIEILNILNNVDTQALYEILETYINKVGDKNISNEIRNMSNEANSKPVELIVNPSPGIYVNPIIVEFDLNNIKFGHEYYYTLDGSTPNKSSQKYMNNIKIDKNTQINIIGYNAKGESTDVYEMEYIIDNTSKIELNQLIKKANSLLDNTEEGTKIGNYKPGSKKNLKNTNDKIEKQLQKQILSYNDINKMKEELNLAIDVFKDNIIKNENIEKQILGKAWFNDEFVFKIANNRIVFTDNFHEGYGYDILSKSSHQNRIDYKVTDIYGISTISISMNENNNININCTEQSNLNGNYKIANKNQIIKLAHESQFISEPPYDDKYCITLYDYFEFAYIGISLNDVKNYYKNSSIR